MAPSCPKLSVVEGDVVKAPYLMKCQCRNCQRHLELTIPHGLSVQSFVSKRQCPICGVSLEGSHWWWNSSEAQPLTISQGFGLSG